MSTLQLNFVPSKYMEDARTNQYTSGAVQGSVVRSIVDKCTVSNSSSVATTFSLNIVNSAGSADGSNLLIDERRVEPGETYDCPEVIGQTLQEGQYISTLAGAVDTLSLRISGREITT
jgi:hypothetical protein